jgi:hypothetical protein
MWNCSEGDPFLREACEAITEVWREQSAVTAFTRFHPLLENHKCVSSMGSPSEEIIEGTPVNGLVFCGQTVSIDLTMTEEESIRSYQKVLRQEINRGRRLGLVTKVDGDWQHLDDFVSIYHLTMGNNHASSQYFFPDRYFRQLHKALGANIYLMLTQYEGQVASAGLFIESNSFMHAHLAGVNEQFRSLSPLKVLLDDVRRWARERGNTLLHLGGGRGGRDDSLFAFKGRFSPRRHRFYTGQWIVNRTAYNLLCKEKQAYASKAGLVLLNPEFFPAYRAPLGEAPGPDFTTISSVSGSGGRVAMAK